VPSRNYQDLVAWQKAMDYVEAVYLASRSFPGDERFGLTSQLRRAAVSIPSNIAEGQGRGSDAELVRFLRVAHGSLRETETQLLIARRLAFLAPASADQLLELSGEVGRLIQGLIKSKASPHADE
jgi:four helix bundle protein